jgi:aryl-alcohol dehydrogenase-like predicted oxidoreductase
MMKGRFKRTGKRADIFLCSKFGFRLPSFALDGTPEYVKTATESSLKKLGVDYIDLYYLHVRLNSTFPSFSIFLTYDSGRTSTFLSRQDFVNGYDIRD